MKTNKNLLTLITVSTMAVLLTACGKPGDSAAGSATEATTAIQSARQAFWQRDLESAEKQYRSLAESNNTSADAWGELGNVYYAQGKWQDAARAYTEAALVLIENKQMGQAMHLHQLVMRMDGEQAMRIDEKLRANSAAKVEQ